MLVLKVQLGQKVYINDGAITVQLTSSGTNWCKLGITAPKTVKILRQAVCPEGPARCSRCGGLLPPPGADGMRVVASTGCDIEPDTESGRCRSFMRSALWGDSVSGQNSKGGAA